MTTLPNRPHTALLVMDAQVGVLANCEDRDAVIGRIAGLLGRARLAGAAVLWIQHLNEVFVEGSEPWAVHPAFCPAAGEVRLSTVFHNALDDEEVQAALERQGIGHLVVCGAMSDVCIRCTIHAALAHGYDVTLVGDAHTTEDLSPYGSPVTPRQAIDYLNTCWEFTSSPGRETAVLDADEVDFTGAH